MEVVKSSEQETHFKCGSLNFYMVNSPSGFTFFEFKVDDVNCSKKELEKEGSKV